MASKTISIKKDVYDGLIRIKRQNESFSDLLQRLAAKENPLAILKNIAGSLDLGDSDELITEIRKKRGSSDNYDIIE